MKVFQINENETLNYGKHLPERYALEKYDKEWLLFGTLTCAKSTSEKSQLRKFKNIMDLIGARNLAEGKRLHWIVRVEGTGQDEHRHLHFLLGKHKVSDGKYCQTDAETVAKIMKAQWTYGMSKILPYDHDQSGLLYALKCANQTEREDTCDMSDGLMRYLRKLSSENIITSSDELMKRLDEVLSS